MTMNKQVKYNKDGSVKSRGIEWADVTWNPIAGCPHQCRWTMPDGNTAICYAESVAEGIAASAYDKGFAAHYWKPEHLESPKGNKNPLKIFVGSMSDVFAHRVPSEQIEAILQVARECTQHKFQMLTKNPTRINDFEIPENVWIGASMPPDFMWGKQLNQNQKERMLHRSLESLGKAKASIKWMSFEPLSWDVAPILRDFPDVLSWAVIGAASNGSKYYAPDKTAFVNLRDMLDSFSVAIFYKGNISILPEAKDKWREEFPVTKQALKANTENPQQLSMF
jgi:protein gp37